VGWRDEEHRISSLSFPRLIMIHTLSFPSPFEQTAQVYSESIFFSSFPRSFCDKSLRNPAWSARDQGLGSVAFFYVALALALSFKCFLTGSLRSFFNQKAAVNVPRNFLYLASACSTPLFIGCFLTTLCLLFRFFSHIGSIQRLHP